MDAQIQNYHYFSEGATVIYQYHGLDNRIFFNARLEHNKDTVG